MLLDPLAGFVRLAMLIGDTVPDVDLLNVDSPRNKFDPATAQPVGTRFAADGEDITSDVVNRLATMMFSQTERILLQLERDRVGIETCYVPASQLVSGGVGVTSLPLLTCGKVFLPPLQSMLNWMVSIQDQDGAEVYISDGASMFGTPLLVTNMTHLDGTPAFVGAVARDYTIKSAVVSQVHKWGLEFASSVEELVSGTATGGNATSLQDTTKNFSVAGVTTDWVVWNKSSGACARVTGVAPTQLDFADGYQSEVPAEPTNVDDEYEVVGPGHVSEGTFVTLSLSDSNDGTYMVVGVDGTKVALAFMSTDEYVPPNLPAISWEDAWRNATPAELAATDLNKGTAEFRTLGKYVINPTMTFSSNFPKKSIDDGNITVASFRHGAVRSFMEQSDYTPFLDSLRSHTDASVVEMVKQVKGFTRYWVGDGLDEFDWRFTPSDSIESIHRRLNSITMDGAYRKTPERSQTPHGASYEQASTEVPGAGRVITVDGGAVELRATDTDDINRAMLRLWSLMTDTSMAALPLEVLQGNWGYRYKDAGEDDLSYLSLTELGYLRVQEVAGGTLSFTPLGGFGALVNSAGGFPLCLKTATRDMVGSIVVLFDGDDYYIGHAITRSWSLVAERVDLYFEGAPPLAFSPTSMWICQTLRSVGAPPPDQWGPQQYHHFFGSPSYDTDVGSTFPFDDDTATAAFLGWSGHSQATGTPIADFVHARIVNPVSPPVADTASFLRAARIDWRGVSVGATVDNDVYHTFFDTFSDITLWGWNGIYDDNDFVPVLSVRHFTDGIDIADRPEAHTSQLGLPFYSNALLPTGIQEGPFAGLRHGRLLSWDANPNQLRVDPALPGYDPLLFSNGTGISLYDDAALYVTGPVLSCSALGPGPGTSLVVDNHSSDSLECLYYDTFTRLEDRVLFTVTDCSDDSKLGTYLITSVDPVTKTVILSRPFAASSEIFDPADTVTGYLWYGAELDLFELGLLDPTSMLKKRDVSIVPSPLERHVIRNVTAVTQSSVTFTNQGEHDNLVRRMTNPSTWVFGSSTAAGLFDGCWSRVISVVSAPPLITVNFAAVTKPLTTGDDMVVVHDSYFTDTAEHRIGGPLEVVPDIHAPGQVRTIFGSKTAQVPFLGGGPTASAYYWALSSKSLRDNYEVAGAAPAQNTYIYGNDVFLNGQVAWGSWDLSDGATMGSITHEPVNSGGDPAGVELTMFGIEDSVAAVEWFKWVENLSAEPEFWLYDPLTVYIHDATWYFNEDSDLYLRSTDQWLDRQLKGSGDIDGALNVWSTSLAFLTDYQSVGLNGIYELSGSKNIGDYAGGHGLHGQPFAVGQVDQSFGGSTMWAAMNSTTRYGFSLATVDYEFDCNDHTHWIYAFFGFTDVNGDPSVFAPDTDGFYKRAWLTMHHAADLQESDALHTLGYGHPRYWDDFLTGSGLNHSDLIDDAISLDNSMHWAFTAGGPKANLPGAIPAADYVSGDVLVGEDRRTLTTHPVRYQTVQPTAGRIGGGFEPFYLSAVADETAGDLFSSKMVWERSTATPGDVNFVVLPFERAIPGSLLTRVMFELSAHDEALDTIADSEFYVDVEREAIQDACPGVYAVANPTIHAPGYTNIYHGKTRVLLYDAAGGVIDPEVGAYQGNNGYNRLIPTAWYDNPVAKPSYHPIDQILLPRSKFQGSKTEYPVWFPRSNVLAVAPWDDCGVGPVCQGAYTVELATGWTRASTDIGVVTNPFVTWDRITGNTLSLRRSQITKGDFLYIWASIGAVSYMMMFPIIGAVDPANPTYADKAIVIYDPLGKANSLVGAATSTVYAASPAFMNVPIKIWTRFVANTIPGAATHAFFLHGEAESMPIDQSFTLPAELMSVYGFGYQQQVTQP